MSEKVVTAGVYKVTFERISRDRNIPPQTYTVEDPDELAELIHKFAAPKCLSRDIDVVVDLAKMSGYILAGMHTAGDFTLELLA